MAVGAISRAAKGLYGFIDLITDGIGPRTQSQELQPTLEMFPFLGADSLRDVEAEAVFAVGTVSQQISLQPPAGRTWIVRSFAGTIQGVSAASCSAHLDISGLPDAVGFGAGTGISVLAVTQAPFTFLGTVERRFGLGHQFTPPLVLIGGGPARLAYQVDAMTALGLDFTQRIHALVHDVPS